MPGMPGGVAPPIATLPPSGLTPAVPGGVAPPIATLPPGRPPSGLMPGMPGGVAPPIATLPPSGLTPTVPGGVAPPIATLPPARGQTKSRHAARAAPTRIVRLPAETCVDARVVQITQSGQKPRPICRETLRDAVDRPATSLTSDVALTPGRDLGVDTLWNVWSQTNYVNTSDRRFGLDMKGRAAIFSTGLDRLLNDNLVVAPLSPCRQAAPPASAIS